MQPQIVRGPKLIDGLVAKGVLRGLAGNEGSYYKDILKDPCAYCNGVGGTKEHIVPASEGGSGGWWNIASACPTCNHERGSKPLLIYLFERSKMVIRVHQHYPPGVIDMALVDGVWVPLSEAGVINDVLRGAKDAGEQDTGGAGGSTDQQIDMLSEGGRLFVGPGGDVRLDVE